MRKLVLSLLEELAVRVAERDSSVMSTSIFAYIEAHVIADYKLPIRRYLVNLWVSWKSYVGTDALLYPVATGDAYLPYNHTLWVGYHGELRKELLQFLIVEVKRDIYEKRS